MLLGPSIGFRSNGAAVAKRLVDPSQSVPFTRDVSRDEGRRGAATSIVRRGPRKFFSRACSHYPLVTLVTLPIIRFEPPTSPTRGPGLINLPVTSRPIPSLVSVVVSTLPPPNPQLPVAPLVFCARSISVQSRREPRRPLQHGRRRLLRELRLRLHRQGQSRSPLLSTSF